MGELLVELLRVPRGVGVWVGWDRDGMGYIFVIVGKVPKVR